MISFDINEDKKVQKRLTQVSRSMVCFFDEKKGKRFGSFLQ